MERHLLIECEDKADRDAMVVILARNGYTVRHKRVRKTGTRASYSNYVECWKDSDGSLLGHG